MKSKIFFIGILLIPMLGKSATGLVDSLKMEMMLGKYQNIADSCPCLLKKDSVNIELYWICSKAYTELYRYTEAKNLLLQAYKMDSLNAPILESLYRINTLVGNDLQAEKFCRLWNKTDTIRKERQIALASLLLKRNKVEQAFEIFDTLVKTDSTNPWLLKQTGICYLQMGQALESVPYFLKSLEKNPEDQSLYQYLVNIALRGTLYDSGMVWASRALKIDSTDIFFIRNTAYFYYLNEEYPWACTYFSKTMQLGDSLPFTIKYRGMALHKNHQDEEALPFLELSFLQEPDNLKLCNMIGLSYQRLGENEKALYYFKKGLEAMNPDPKILCAFHEEMAKTYWFEGNRKTSKGMTKEANESFASALQEFEMIMKINPEDVATLVNIAFMQEKIFFNMEEALLANELFLQKFVPESPEDSVTIDYTKQKIEELTLKIKEKKGN